MGTSNMRILLALAAVLPAAAPSSPVTSFDPSTNFSHYRTYQWVFASPPGGMDVNLYRQIRVAVDHSLGAHGFVQADYGDFAVAFTLGPRENVHASDYGNYAPYYAAEEAAAHKAWVNQELAGLSTHEHSLAIDIYDANSKHSIWHGVAPIPIVPQTRAAVVEHEVYDVLSLFPPKNVCSATGTASNCAR
jgi:hypothetical protein